MIKIFSITLIMFITATIALSQAKSSEAIAKQIKALKAEKVFALSYDKSSDASKILGFSEDFGKEQNSRNNLSSLRFGLAFFFPGKSLTVAPNEYLLTFQAGSKKPKLADSHALKFMIDNENLDFGDARYADKNEGIEYLNFKITRDQLARLAKGKIVKMRIGNAEFTLSPEQIKMFANLFALSDPATM